MKIVIVTGMSGAGRTTALRMFEDLDYYCIDNIPFNLLKVLSSGSLSRQDPRFQTLALGIDSRATVDEIAAFPERLQELRDYDIDIDVLFLDADDDVLLRRYSETRRRHPLTNAKTPLKEAISAERALLTPIAELADIRIDTSRSNLHQLREKIRSIQTGNDADTLSLLFQSFGFKFGVPDGVDYVFDVRCLPNPHWDESLRSQTGKDAGVGNFLQKAGGMDMADDIDAFLTKWLPRHQEQDRAYVSVAIGCTGGRHRSVYVVEQLAERYRKRYRQVLVRHTELQ